MVIRRRLRKDDDLVLHPFSSFCPGDRFNGLLSILCGSLKREPVSFESVIESNGSEPSPIISVSQGEGRVPYQRKPFPRLKKPTNMRHLISARLIPRPAVLVLFLPPLW